MTKVIIDPGVCGFVATVTAVADEDELSEVTVHVNCECKAVQDMMESLGTQFDAYAVCLVKPGKGPFFDYASENFPVHAACPILAGLSKCIEAECGLALKKNVSIAFVDD